MYEVIWVGMVAYSFTDKQTGKPVSGASKKCVILRHDENGNVSGVDVCKMSEDPATAEGVYSGAVLTEIYYDRFGRVIGGR